jgi:hypothetical protein
LISRRKSGPEGERGKHIQYVTLSFLPWFFFVLRTGRTLFQPGQGRMLFLPRRQSEMSRLGRPKALFFIAGKFLRPSGVATTQNATFAQLQNPVKENNPNNEKLNFPLESKGEAKKGCFFTSKDYKNERKLCLFCSFLIKKTMNLWQ